MKMKTIKTLTVKMTKKMNELFMKLKFFEREKIIPITEAAKNIFVTKKIQTKIILDSF